MQQNKDAIFICNNAYEIDNFNKNAVYSHQIQLVNSSLNEILIKSLKLQDDLQEINEQINSTFTFNKDVDFSYYTFNYDIHSIYGGNWERVEIRVNFLLFDGIDKIELHRHSNMFDLYLSVIDENLKTHSLKISSLCHKQNMFERLVEIIRNRAGNQCAKLKFKRAKIKKPERKKKNE